MIKKVSVGTKEITFKSSGAIPYLYRLAFPGGDLLRDIQPKDGNVDTGVVERLAWVMAKHANPETPAIEEWLGEFELFDLYNAMPEIMDIWGNETRTTSNPKK